jgi:hypothetical protein
MVDHDISVTMLTRCGGGRVYNIGYVALIRWAEKEA